MTRPSAADTHTGMIRDLRTIIDGWEYEPGKISVRKIIGRDGREKIQTRIDMGLLQMEPDGPPDGQRIAGYDSVLERLEAELRRHIAVYGDDQDFVLSPEQCVDLRREAYLYYQRYLSLFVLEDYERVARDTARNLRAIELYEVRRLGRGPPAWPQRGYVLMMHARSRAARPAGGRYDDALRLVTEGGPRLRPRARDAGRASSFASEMRVLAALRGKSCPDAARLARPPSPRAARALEGEDYERAAFAAGPPNHLPKGTQSFLP